VTSTVVRLANPSALRGIGLVLSATLAFGLSDTMMKHLAMRYDVSAILFFRYLINFIVVVAIFAPREGMAVFRTQRTGLVILRGLSLAFASITLGLALRVMPVGEAIAIIYLAPFGVILTGWLLLGETVRPATWVACLTAFAGVLLIARPGAGLAPLGVFLTLVNVIPAIAYHILSRHLSATETTSALVTWTALMGTLTFGALLPWTLPGFSPGLADSLLIATMALTATFGHILFTRAFAHAPASLLAPFNYSHLVWAGLLGLIIFGHLPDALSLAGMALVALAGAGAALATHSERQRNLRVTPPTQ
jgi:drug/metabolite transporter (DMT)-like permease